MSSSLSSSAAEGQGRHCHWLPCLTVYIFSKVSLAAKDLPSPTLQEKQKHILQGSSSCCWHLHLGAPPSGSSQETGAWHLARRKRRRKLSLRVRRRAVLSHDSDSATTEKKLQQMSAFKTWSWWLIFLLVLFLVLVGLLLRRVALWLSAIGAVANHHLLLKQQTTKLSTQNLPAATTFQPSDHSIVSHLLAKNCLAGTLKAQRGNNSFQASCNRDNMPTQDWVPYNTR